MGVNWTKEQKQAIETTGNNILVAAAAGSGKTAVLVERMIHKIVDEGVDIDKILIVTFTNAAAAEMKERILEAIYQKLEEEPGNIRLQKQITLLSKANICTIDSFCLEVVRNYFYEIDVSPNFKIADTTELELIKLEALEEVFERNYEEKNQDFLELVETYTKYLSDDPLKDLILNIYTFIQSSPFPREWLAEKVKEFDIENTDQDFATTKWGKIIMQEIKDQLLDCKMKLQEVYKQTAGYEELKKYTDVLGADIGQIDTAMAQETWNAMVEVAGNIQFEKWPTDRKITLEVKELAKQKRDVVKKQFNKAVEVLNGNSEQAMEDLLEMHSKLNIIKDLVFAFEDEFTKQKREKNIADFNDIEHFALNILLQKNEEGSYAPSSVAEKYRNKFQEIAIDEYQDSNMVQEYILSSISNGKNMFMVGDVKQSIYKFRQACPDLFLQKYETYQDADEEENAEGIKIQLFKNFRSRKNILDTTNLVFQTIMSKGLGDINYNENEYLNLGAEFEEVEGKLLATNTQIYVIENKDQTDEDLLQEPTENVEIEAKFVAQKIKEIIASGKLVYDKKQGYRPVTYKDIVVLLRATKNKANVFEKEINKLAMPVFSDTSAEYLESIEIQTMMSLLKIIDNPMQDIPLVTVLRSVIGKFTDNELIEIRLATGTNMTFYESMKQYVEIRNNRIDVGAQCMHPERMQFVPTNRRKNYRQNQPILRTIRNLARRKK